MHEAETGHHSGAPLVFSGIFYFYVMGCISLFVLLPFFFAIISDYQWYLQFFLIKVI